MSASSSSDSAGVRRVFPNQAETVPFVFLPISVSETRRREKLSIVIRRRVSEERLLLWFSQKSFKSFWLRSERRRFQVSQDKEGIVGNVVSVAHWGKGRGVRLQGRRGGPGETPAGPRGE